MLDHLDSCESVDVDVDELEYFLLAPDALDVDVKYIALHARTSDFWVASVER